MHALLRHPARSLRAAAASTATRRQIHYYDALSHLEQPHYQPQLEANSAYTLAHDRKKVVVAVSGGVDSSVAALLVRDRVGAENVVGMYMRNWNAADEAGETLQCSGEEDLRSAREVCAELGIAFRCLDFEKEYWTMVFEPFLQDLQRRGTPNPDVFCNRWIKFDVALRQARQIYGDQVVFATGHYARIGYKYRDGFGFGYRDGYGYKDGSNSTSFVSEGSGSGSGSGEGSLFVDADKHRWIEERRRQGWGGCSGNSVINDGFDAEYHLCEPVDAHKDQTYFLSCIKGEALRNVCFPVGGLAKTEVRRIAAEHGLSTARRKDSVGICFVGKRDFGSFLDDYIESEPGKIVNVDDGGVVGVHQGLHRLTIGQNARISGRSCKSFVVDKDMAANVVYVAEGDSHPALYSAGLTVSADEMFWINGAPSEAIASSLDCRIRYNQEKIPCSVEAQSATEITVRFRQPEKAVAPGQIVAFYDGSVCLGGGVISGAIRVSQEADEPLQESAALS